MLPQRGAAGKRVWTKTALTVRGDVLIVADRLDDFVFGG